MPSCRPARGRSSTGRSSTTAGSASQVNLAWADPTPLETGFVVDRATNAAFTVNLVSTALSADTTSLTVTGLSTTATRRCWGSRSAAGGWAVLAAGWRPADSQLARSSKFVPMMAALLEQRAESPHYRVGDRVPLPTAGRDGVRVRTPGGNAVTLPTGATAFDGTDEPGVYSLETAAGPAAVAVNLDPAESLTSPLPVVTLEQVGVRLAERDAAPPDAAKLRQMRGAE